MTHICDLVPVPFLRRRGEPRFASEDDLIPTPSKYQIEVLAAKPTHIRSSLHTNYVNDWLTKVSHSKTLQRETTNETCQPWAFARFDSPQVRHMQLSGTRLSGSSFVCFE